MDDLVTQCMNTILDDPKLNNATKVALLKAVRLINWYIELEEED